MRGTARVFVDPGGRPATVPRKMGDPLGKMTNGVLAHRAGPAALAIRWADRGAGVHVVEGLADALAVASP